MDKNIPGNEALTPVQLAQMIDHTSLQPNLTEQNLVITCREALEYSIGVVVVNPIWVERAAKELTGSTVRVATVAGFPLGANRTEFKIVEAVRGAIDGATEIDMVANIGWLVSGEFARAEDEIGEIRKSLPESVALKVIIETTLLDSTQMEQATRAVIRAGAQFVKTSTGFYGGATIKQVAKLHTSVAGRIGIKASGGIRSLNQCRDLIAAGATRIGTSASISILNEFSSPS